MRFNGLVTFYKKHLPLLEFSLRVYVASYLFSYGYAKLDGTMFANTTPAILKTELGKVDMFHLTWYYYSQSKALSITTGSLQLLSALFLLFNRTVLLGCVTAIPIFFCIFLVNADATARIYGPILATRALLYLFCLCLFMLYRKKSTAAIVKIMLGDTYKLKLVNKLHLLFVPLLFAFYFLVEWVLDDIPKLFIFLCGHK